MEQFAHFTNDMWWFHVYGENILKGLIPYRDFYPEYPPFSLIIFTIAQIFGTPWFSLIFYFEVLLFIVLGALIIKKLQGNYWIWLGLLFALGILNWERFDIFPAVFTLLSIYYLKHNKNNLAFLTLSIATLLKFYAIFLLPILILYSFPKHYLKGLALYLTVIILTFTLIIINGGYVGLSRLISYHIRRGLQPEAVKALPLLMSKKTIIIYNSGSKSYEIQQ